MLAKVALSLADHGLANRAVGFELWKECQSKHRLDPQRRQPAWMRRPLKILPTQIHAFAQDEAVWFSRTVGNK